LEVDTIFARAHQANLQTALLGTAAWRRLIPRNQLDYTYFTEQLGPEADATLMEAALPIIEKGEVELTLLQFNQVDLAGQNSNGPASDAYRRAADQIDTYLGQISQAMDFNQSVLLVLSDHGHIPDGGYGGN